MRAVLLCLPLVVASVGADAETARVDRIDILDKGIYRIETGEQTPEPSTPTGEITAVMDVRNVESTTTIPARRGLEFGFRYFVAGEPDGAEVSFDIVNIYPPQGLRPPDGREPVRESRYRRTKKIGETAYLGYGFENDWEAEPGTWTFQIWHENRKLAEQSFTVVK